MTTCHPPTPTPVVRFCFLVSTSTERRTTNVSPMVSFSSRLDAPLRPEAGDEGLVGCDMQLACRTARQAVQPPESVTRVGHPRRSPATPEALFVAAAVPRGELHQFPTCGRTGCHSGPRVCVSSCSFVAFVGSTNLVGVNFTCVTHNLCGVGHAAWRCQLRG